MTFSISPQEWWYFPFKIQIWCSKREQFSMLLPLLHHMVPLTTDIFAAQCPLGRCTYDALSHTFDISVFQNVKKNSTTIKHIHDWSENIIGGFGVVFDTSDCYNFLWTVLFGMKSMVTQVRLCYTWDYLTPDICSFIKPTAMENWCHFLSKSTVML